jgi:hypothetical protein
MPHAIVRIFEPLLRLLLPAPGHRHRPDQRSAGRRVEAPTARPSRASAPPVLRGEENGLVRPHLVAHERREQELQGARRRVASPAIHGIGMNAQLVHAVQARAW